MRKFLAILALSAVAVASGGAAQVAGLTVTARRAVLAAAGASVTLTGDYTCGPFAGGVPDRGVIDLTIRQVAGGGTVTGFGFLEPAVCDGAEHVFSVGLPSTGGLFRAGAAQWSASGYVEGGGGTQTVSVPPTAIRIR